MIDLSKIYQADAPELVKVDGVSFECFLCKDATVGDMLRGLDVAEIAKEGARQIYYVVASKLRDNAGKYLFDITEQGLRQVDLIPLPEMQKIIDVFNRVNGAELAEPEKKS